MSKKNRVVQGVGVNDYDGPVSASGRLIDSYNVWKGILQRCYSTKHQIIAPTYIGCSVCEEWLSFSNFKKWYDKNYIEGFELGKDILFEGNKIYSPETCRFIPVHISRLLNDRKNARGDLPLGVVENPFITQSKTYQYYLAKCRGINGEHLNKSFKTMEEASAWYSATKTSVVREVAQTALDAGEIQQDVFDALIRRKF